MGSRSLLSGVFALLVAPVVALGAVPAWAATTAPPGAPGVWVRPVAGAVARPFLAPRAKYGPGHRGVDFVAPTGTAVHAAREGTVTFAGDVAGSLHVVIDHADGLRTSYSFLARVDVRVGQRVVRGQILGGAGGIGPDHDVGVVHFGARAGDQYFDPMLLFAAVDLAAVVHLVPARAPDQAGLRSPALEARSLVEALRLGRATPGVGPHLGPDGQPSLWGDAWDAGGDLVGGLVEVGGVLVRPFAVVGRYVLDHTAVGAGIQDLRTMASRFAEYLHSRGDCTDDTKAAPGGGGSGHSLMAVGGINSSTDPRTGATFGLDTRALGYHADEVQWFSYASRGGTYRQSDTWGDLVVKAYALRNQLRATEARHPGREVDLIAHSQGGVVVDVFMQLVYDPADPTLPPLGTVVTLSSPHLGDPLASVAHEVRSSKEGRRLLDAAEGLAGGALPPSAGRSTRQLAEGSDLIRHLWDRPLPDQMQVTSIGTPDDLVVPADRTEAPGARHVTSDPSGLGDHSAIVADPDVMRDVRLALEQRPPACVGWLQGIREAVEPVLIRRFELNLGHAISHAIHP